MAVIIAFSLVILPNSFANAQEATNYSDVIQQAQVKANMLTAYYGETSVQYALIDNGEIVISGHSGVYSKDSSTALTDETMYGIGSVSKIFTSVAVMQLAEQGKIDLDTPVFKYIPEFKMKDARYKKITVRMLLNHSSGIMGTSLSNAMLFEDNDTMNMDNLLDVLATQRLKADPGEFSVYCNDGFGLAQLLIEKVSGLEFSDYIKKYISEPLSMSNTKTPLDDFDTDQLAKTYSSDNIAFPVENVNMIGAGGIYSTAEDLCQFAGLFMKNTDSQLLSNNSALAMSNAEYLNGFWYPQAASTLSYGLGWDSVTTYPFTKYGIQALVKGGDTLLYHCSLITLPKEGMAMAVISSGGASIYNEVFAQEVILDVLLAKGSIKELKAEETNVAPVKASLPSEFKAYAGYYAYSGGIIKIDINDNGILKLYNSQTNTIAQQFIYSGDDKFYSKDGSYFVTFNKESNGNIYLYVASNSLLPYLGQYVSAEYQAQKVAANSLSKKVKAAWEKRDNKMYFALNEKYSSMGYSLNYLILKLSMWKGLEGYAWNAEIIDENTAKPTIQIPGVYGRDLFDYNFYTVKKAEYMEAGGSVYISEDAIKALSNKAAFNVKIGTDGYAKWYKVKASSKNKKIKVTIPKNASFTVYDEYANCVDNSWTTGQTTVSLPKDGYIVFAGNAGVKFTVKYVD